MYISNKQLYLENGSLRLRFDVLYFESKRNDIIRSVLKLQQELIGRFNDLDKQVVINALDRKVLRENTEINAISELEQVIVLGSSVSYRLPTDSQLMFEFLLTVDVLQNANNFDSQHFNDFSIVEKMLEDVEREKSVVVEDYLKMGKISSDTALSKIIAEKILSKGRGLLPEYEACYDALETIYQYSREKLTDFSQCLHTKPRFAILAGIKMQDLIAFSSPEFFLTDKLQVIFNIQRKLLSEGKKKDLYHLISQLEFEAKKVLYAPCIGKKAHDGGRYHWNYTEWDLIKAAEFNTRSDGKISIKVENNPAYIKNYAPGTRDHKVMEAEFKHLGSIIGLEFDEKSNAHKEIIFTENCTKKLMVIGLHYNHAYLKKLTALKNTWSYFKHAQTDWKDKNVSYLAWLPPEIFKSILDYSGYNLSKQELNQMNEEIATQRIAWPGYK